MNFIVKILLSRMARQKKSALFATLAIAASSCLIVWTIGGFQALFIDASTQDVDYLGTYDLRIAPKISKERERMGGAAFGGPFVTRSKETAPSAAVDDSVRAQNQTPKEARAARDNRAPNERSARGGKRGGRGSTNEISLSPQLLDALRADESVALCDATSTLRMFVYSPGSERSILEDDEAEDEGSKPTIKRSLELTDDEADEFSSASKGIDPALHRKAFGAYRATMGTPMGMGSTFQATSATETPYELKDGRWFHTKDAQNRTPREAVVTVKGNERLRAKVGDKLLLIDKSSLIDATSEYQLEVVGIVDDTETDGFYISRALAEEFKKGSDEPLAISGAYLKLRGGAAQIAAFRERWNERLNASASQFETSTREEIAARKAAAFKAEQSFKYQAASGTLLAALASLLIVFTALNMSVDEQKRLIAFYRISGLTRGQVGLSILLESFLLATPGWIAGMLVGWALVFICSGKPTGLNLQTVGFSFLCAVVSAILAALYPIFRSALARPLDALGTRESRNFSSKARRKRSSLFALFGCVGIALIAADVYLVQFLPMETTQKAALHSGLGVLMLAVGIVCLTPILIRLAELLLLPILSRVFCFDGRALRRELSGNASRIVAVAVALSVGGGLFVTMQIWGYSMLEPFLPGRRAPDAFAAFLPNGLHPEIVEKLRSASFVDPNRFISVAVEQAAFAEGSVPEDARKSQFANVVFFGVDVAKAFEGETPLVGMRFREGDPKRAFLEMKNGRGVVVTDSLSIDYGLKLGDALKVTHPRNPKKTLEYPIVGVVSFTGWQWLSKTGGVRRNFGRSGGIVFAREGIIVNDYQLDRSSYFWFDAPQGKNLDYASTEAYCDVLARENLALDLTEEKDSAPTSARAAYVKLSTRDSLTNSISRRADGVIWGLSKTPLTTLIIASIAVVGAVANSVRSRRWQYGVMRAVGLTRWAIIRAIIVEGILIGCVAAATSFLFGFLAAQGALKLGRSMFGSVDPPLILPVKGLAIGLALTVALCLVAALYPAIKTGRTEILKLLQSGRAPE